MSTLGSIGAVAGGILGGMNIKNAMEKQKLEEERLRKEMEWRREDREYQRGERERAEQERAAGDAYYAKLGATKFMQPGDPGKESIMVPADPNAPDEPTMGVARAEQTPRSEIAKVGMQEAFRDKPVDYEAMAQKDADALNQFKMQAYSLRGQDRVNAMAALNEKKAELLSGYLRQYAGDPNADAYEYAKKAGRIGAFFGEIPTGLQAIQFSNLMKKHQEEGAQHALKLANAGDKAGALKAWNENGEHKFADLELVPAQSSMKTPSFKMIGITKDGKRIELAEGMTAFDAAISLESGIKAAELAMNKQKMDADAKNAERDDARAEKTSAASIRASDASVAASNANAAQTRLENEWMKKNGGAKPGSTSSAYKVEMNEVAQAFSTPATDSKGKPIIDLMTGRQVVNRDQAKEREFMQWMSKNGITDTNKGLALYLGGGTQQPSASGYDSYVNAFNQAKAAGNKQAMQELTNAARSAGIVK